MLKFISFLFFLTFSGELFSATCFIPEPTSTNRLENGIINKTWIIRDRKVYWSYELTNDLSYLRYRKAIKENIDWDPFHILMKQLSLFSDSPNENMKKEGRNIKAVLGRKAGMIRRINCLESLLLSEQSHRFPLESHPYEFLASIFKKNIGDQVFIKIHLATNNKHFQRPNLQIIEESMNDGWIFWAHLHNHPFYFENYPDGMYQGMLVPSINDVKVYQSWYETFELSLALITNGLHTISVQSHEFKSFQIP